MWHYLRLWRFRPFTIDGEMSVSVMTQRITLRQRKLSTAKGVLNALNGIEWTRTMGPGCETYLYRYRPNGGGRKKKEFLYFKNFLTCGFKQDGRNAGTLKRLPGIDTSSERIFHDRSTRSVACCLIHIFLLVTIFQRTIYNLCRFYILFRPSTAKKTNWYQII